MARTAGEKLGSLILPLFLLEILAGVLAGAGVGAVLGFVLGHFDGRNSRRFEGRESSGLGLDPDTGIG